MVGWNKGRGRAPRKMLRVAPATLKYSYAVLPYADRLIFFLLLIHTSARSSFSFNLGEVNMALHTSRTHRLFVRHYIANSHIYRGSRNNYSRFCLSLKVPRAGRNRVYSFNVKRKKKKENANLSPSRILENVTLSDRSLERLRKAEVKYRYVVGYSP